MKKRIYLYSFFWPLAGTHNGRNLFFVVLEGDIHQARKNGQREVSVCNVLLEGVFFFGLFACLFFFFKEGDLRRLKLVSDHVNKGDQVGNIDLSVAVAVAGNARRVAGRRASGRRWRRQALPSHTYEKDPLE